MRGDIRMGKLTSGWAIDRETFSDAARKVFSVAVNHRREGLRLPDDAERGGRFGDDGAILARLESMFTEAEFMECPGMRIDSALIDAAQSDHWYNHEKDYEMPEMEIDDDE